jgi:FkbM family methyltransferase
LKVGARFIDGGAYDGDTYAQMVRRGVRLGSYVALEPDPSTYRRLAARLREGVGRPGEVLLLPCAAWSQTCQLSFAADGSEGSAVSSAGSARVQAVALDEALPGYRPDLLKLDVEGAEIEALTGAREMIRQARPILAVAVYHQPEHLWTIPFLLQAREPGYTFHLRYHQFGGNDIVLYALPHPAASQDEPEDRP